MPPIRRLLARCLAAGLFVVCGQAIAALTVELSNRDPANAGPPTCYVVAWNGRKSACVRNGEHFVEDLGPFVGNVEYGPMIRPRMRGGRATPWFQGDSVHMDAVHANLLLSIECSRSVGCTVSVQPS